MRRAWGALAGVVIALAAGIACESFGSDDPPDPTRDATDGSTIGEFDADAEDGGAAEPTFRPACPRPAAPGDDCSAAAATCSRELLYEPDVANHPFGIVLGPRHVFWLAQARTDGGGDAYNGTAAATLYRLDRATRTVEILAQNQQSATLLATNGEALFWFARNDVSNRFVLRTIPNGARPCTVSGCEETDVLDDFDQIARMAFLRRDLLFAVQPNGAVFRIDLQGTPSAIETSAGVGSLPAIVAGLDAVFVSGALRPDVLRIEDDGRHRVAGSIPPRDASHAGAGQIATNCSDLFVALAGNAIEKAPISANPATFEPFALLPSALAIYAYGTDARFIYAGSANGRGLYRVDTTPPRAEQLSTGSIWALDVGDDVVVFGEHGLSLTDMAAHVGSIYQIEK